MNNNHLPSCLPELGADWLNDWPGLRRLQCSNWPLFIARLCPFFFSHSFYALWFTQIAFRRLKSGYQRKEEAAKETSRALGSELGCDWAGLIAESKLLMIWLLTVLAGAECHWHWHRGIGIIQPALYPSDLAVIPSNPLFLSPYLLAYSAAMRFARVNNQIQSGIGSNSDFSWISSFAIWMLSPIQNAII